MSKYDDYLKAVHKECQNLIQAAQAKTTETLEPIIEQFQKNTLDNIPQQFGDFLYTCLGDRVVGQSNSVINQAYLDAHTELSTNAQNMDMTIEEYIKKKQKEQNELPHYMRRYNRYDQYQIWITTGRKFGVSYIAGDGNRKHTIYFGAGECFQHLTQEHVDCIHNKLKKSCAQSFLDFRNDFSNGLLELGDTIIPVDVQTKLGIVSCIRKSPKINTNANSYRDTEVKNYHILDDIMDSRITHVHAQMNIIPIWNKKSTVIARDAKSEIVNYPSYVTLTFLNINTVERTIAIIGNIDIGMSQVNTSMHNACMLEQRQVLNRLPYISYDTYNYIKSSPAMRESGLNDGIERDAEGVLLNMDEVINHPQVKDIIDTRIKFYNDMSDRLQQMKHENATLYFVNADM